MRFQQPRKPSIPKPRTRAQVQTPPLKRFEQVGRSGRIPLTLIPGSSTNAIAEALQIFSASIHYRRPCYAQTLQRYAEQVRNGWNSNSAVDNMTDVPEPNEDLEETELRTPVILEWPVVNAETANITTDSTPPPPHDIPYNSFDIPAGFTCEYVFVLFEWEVVTVSPAGSNITVYIGASFANSRSRSTNGQYTDFIDATGSLATAITSGAGSTLTGGITGSWSGSGATTYNVKRCTVKAFGYT